MRRPAERALSCSLPRSMSPASRNASNSWDRMCAGQVDLPFSFLCPLLFSAAPAYGRAYVSDPLKIATRCCHNVLHHFCSHTSE